MLDNILNSVRRGAGRVQRRGEEVAQTTRLRLEVFQLTRELDTLYARLGRSYHGGADRGVLEGLRDDIRRVDDEISARERLIRELSHEEAGGEGTLETASTTIVASPVFPEERDRRPDSLSNPVSGAGIPAGSEPTIPDAMPRPDAQGTAPSTGRPDSGTPPDGETGRR